MKLDILTLFNSALIMLVPILVGYFLQKRNVLGKEFSSSLSFTVLSIAQPFMIVTSILGTEYSKDNLSSGFKVLLLALITHAIAALVAFFSTAGIKDRKDGRVAECTMIFANCGFFGFPLLKAVYGSIGVFWGGFYIIIFNLILWTYGVFVLNRANRGFKFDPKKIFLNSGTVPCVIGFALYILRVPIYEPLFNSMDRLGSVCTPLSMVAIGTMLAKVPLKRLFTKAIPYYVALFKLFLLPLICGTVLAILGFQRDLATFGALMTSLPSGATTAMFAEKYDISPQTAAQTVGISTVMSIITVPFTVGLADIIIKAILKV